MDLSSWLLLTKLKARLPHRFQRCKMNNTFSKWGKALVGVLQGSTLCSLLFITFIDDKARHIFRKTKISYPLIRNDTLFSWNTRFEIRSFDLLTTIFLFPQKCDLANYAGESKMYTSNESISNIINSLSSPFTVLCIEVYDNFMALKVFATAKMKKKFSWLLLYFFILMFL